MISLYVGTPGSGKSLHASRDIYWRLRRGKPVFCNFPLDLAAVGLEDRDALYHYRGNARLDPVELVDFSRDWFDSRRVVEDDILLVIDEAQLIFNSRTWNDKMRMDWIQFFSQSRHFGYKVVLIAQSSEMIDKQFRALVEFVDEHRKVKYQGWFGRLLTLGGVLPLHVDIRTLFQSGIRDYADYFLARKRYMRIYDSYRLFDAEEV